MATDKPSKPSEPQLTTTAGNPIADNQNSLSAGYMPRVGARTGR
jgi:catalase